MRAITGWMILAALLLTLSAGCRSDSTESEAPDAAASGADGETETSPGSVTDDQLSTAPELPAGHPPIGDAAPSRPDDGQLTFKPSQGWEPIEPRNQMIQEAYLLPRQDDGSDDAVLEVTFFPGMKDIPFSDQVERWESQFILPEGQPGRISKKQTAVPGGNHPIQLLDIRGTYQEQTMMGQARGEPNENYRMLAAQIDGPTGPSFVKVIGPDDTVTHWEDVFTSFIKSAE